MLNSRFLLSESLPRLVSLSVNSYDSSGVPLFGQCNCRRGRRGTSSPVSVASRLFSVTGFRPRSTGILPLTESIGGKPTTVSVASSVHSEGFPPGFLCNRRQTSEVRFPPNSDLSMCSCSHRLYFLRTGLCSGTPVHNQLYPRLSD